MIELAGLTKVFGRGPGSNRAVDDLTCSIEPGVVTGFLGPNGAGKTTTMRMILGLDHPTSGTATIDGKTYRQLADPLRTVGALLDAKQVHPNRSARDHLRWIAATNRIAITRVDEVLDVVGLTSAADKKAGTLSLGMSQRLGIAAALLGDPRGAAVRRTRQRARPRGHPLGQDADAHAGGGGPHRVRVQPPARRDGQHRRPAGGDRSRQAHRLDHRRRVRRRTRTQAPSGSAAPSWTPSAGCCPARASRPPPSRTARRCRCAARRSR